MADNQLSKLQASLVVTGDIWQPELLTEFIGLQPSKIIHKGEQRPGKRPSAPFTEWILETDWKETDNIEGIINSLLDFLCNKQSEFIKFVRQNDLYVTIICSVEIYSERPEFHLSKDTIKKIASLDSEIGFDIYDFT